ncbi:hypothetical protein MJA45_18815 [Paenibacillus aurantius]|uniref:DUF4907 domain-containing protein n=1 Tax=Paenibacillus aurantius TaxID=2918900 RepID=A0AA96L9U1_9BACL|nr:hypothetical protein [Paenibacillus aurantius]WNQ09667.1 hypothetical protein MJA45_18815 [Paenibacillus aurantius]
MPNSKCKLLHVACLFAIVLSTCLSGCSNNAKGPEQVIMKLIFYSSNKEGIEVLFHFTEGGGYRMYGITKHTAEGKEEWQFTAVKLIPITEKTTEIEKIKKLAVQYHVNVNEEELPPEQWGGTE